ncbi:hypothetical protein PSYJA_11745 [Pseudomonas syringae pv. japonica str. M301072]|uniref:Uncharacterized protein n=1 Tax=Pseudomonas syringae pv. japonica str. M301072 TaxID=629262 RepID=F3FHB7_PSESX|nr:hypothetical protein PSYJA_11745 [Pseudomonas syringae pv. japonica str. M301072]
MTSNRAWVGRRAAKKGVAAKSQITACTVRISQQKQAVNRIQEYLLKFEVFNII